MIPRSATRRPESRRWPRLRAWLSLAPAADIQNATKSGVHAATQQSASSPKRPDWNRGLRSCSQVTTLAHLRATLRMKRDDNPMMPTEGLGDAPSRAAKAKSPGERAEDTDLRCEDGVCAAFTGLVAGLSAGPSKRRVEAWRAVAEGRRRRCTRRRRTGDGCGKVPGVRRRPAHLRPASWPATGHAFSLLGVWGSTTAC